MVDGDYYTIENAGGHDEYYPHLWTQKVSLDLEDVYGAEETVKSRLLAKPESDPHSNPGDYYYIEKHIIKKYRAEGELLWDQDVAIIGEEKLFSITNFSTYFKKRGDAPESNGLSAGGRKLCDDYPYGFARPILFRLTSTGVILHYSSAFEPYQQLENIRAVISGLDNDCYVFGETLKKGEGNGFYLMHLGLYPMKVISMRYVNYSAEDLEITIEEEPLFNNVYHSIYEVYAVYDQDSGAFSFTVFTNLNHYSRNLRDLGRIITINIEPQSK